MNGVLKWVIFTNRLKCIKAYMKKGDRLRMKEPEMYRLIKKRVFNGKEFLK